jgi:sigma-54 dependent transcriptional regulator, flagellar regulatory protein
MVEESRLLLIDDNERACQDLEVVLGFLGEKSLSAGSDKWLATAQQHSLNPVDISLVILGGSVNLPPQQIMKAILDWDAGIPFLLLGNNHPNEYEDSEIQSNIIAQVALPLSYQPLLDALHKGQVFREHYKRMHALGGVRDFNMFGSLVGISREIQQIRQMMGQVADKEVSVLITGDSGTGKEVVARNLHLNSTRANKPFVPINCGAIPRELLESELFGHEKGAFTGAIASRAGRFELADGGTLFLDEIGDMPLNMQVKLLRVLQERSFERVGGVKTLQTDVRIIAATHRDLEQMIERGEFRQDLYYRINVFPIEMPALRDRVEDIPLLLNDLISVMEAEKRGSVRFNSGAIAALCRYSWPGNVRELANLIERMAILHPHGIVGVSDLPKKFRQLEELALASEKSIENAELIQQRAVREAELSASLPLIGLDLKEYLANLEKNLIEQALDDCDGVVARAAERLHIRRTTLVEKIRKYSLQKEYIGAEDDSSEEDLEPENRAANG